MEFLPDNIISYTSKHTERGTKLLDQLERETWAKTMNPRMLSGHIQGRFLSMIAKMISPNNILEIGTYTGYSALCLVEGLQKNGILHTLDINEEHTFIANNFFSKSEYKKNIKQHIGNAIDIIPKINDRFQLVFIDADKENYSNYLDLIINKVDSGGYIIADNVLWSGKVTNTIKDKETEAIDKYNKKVVNDSRLENILLPIRDGLMITRKK